MNILLEGVLSDIYHFIIDFVYDVIDVLEGMGHFGLAIYTFFEVVLVIPPIEVIYYPLILLENADPWYFYLLNVVFFNVIASAIGYHIGKKIGYPVLRFFASEEILDKAHKLFEKWGVLAVAVGAFVPFVPYTIVVFLGGITKMDFKKFMISGFLGRVPRYVIGGYLIAFAKATIDSQEINEYMLIVSVVGMLLFIIYYILQGIYNLYKRQRTV